MNRRKTRSLSLCSLLLPVLLLGGCLGYSTYPPVDGQTARADPNSTALTEAVVVALRWTLNRHPAPATAEGEPAAALNLFSGVSRSTYEWVSEQAGGGLTPITPRTASLPTYHITQVRLRGSVAEVDLLRPVFDLRRADGTLPLQPLTIHLVGAYGTWKVERRVPFSVNSQEAPAPFYLPPRRLPTGEVIEDETP
ncbi:MAG: hypothetical protein AAGI17_06985 [Planctomycetota bacterium]